METIYKIGIFGIIILGIAHSLLTFKIYQNKDENAFWFFSAGIALILAGILNYTNINFVNENFLWVLMGNIILFIFSVSLAVKQKKITMYLVTIFSFVLLLSVILLKYGK